MEASTFGDALISRLDDFATITAAMNSGLTGSCAVCDLPAFFAFFIIDYLCAMWNHANVAAAQLIAVESVSFEIAALRTVCGGPDFIVSCPVWVVSVMADINMHSLHV